MNLVTLYKALGGGWETELPLASDRPLRHGCSTSYVQRWSARFRAGRLSGLAAQHKGRAASKVAAKLDARILEWTRRGPDDGSTHWSSRRLAADLEPNGALPRSAA